MGDRRIIRNRAKIAATILSFVRATGTLIAATLGTALGEMFDFEGLRSACLAQSRWTFFFVAAPIKIPGGLGSPGNALAIL